MKLSTYSGKGVGHYQTALDGRADWSPEFYRYIEKSEGRAQENVELRFGFEQVDRAMQSLKKAHAHWHDVVFAMDVEGKSLEDMIETYKRDASTLKRYRTKAIMFLFRQLVINPERPERKLQVRIIKVS